MPLAFLRRDARSAPFREERVVVHVPRMAPFEAVVARVVEGGAELALTSAPGVPLRFLHHRAATVAPPNGDETLAGTLLGVAGRHGRLREDVLHFIHAREAVPAADQRRAFARVETIRPVTMVPARFKVGWLDGATRNLSAGGALVTGAARLAEGERLRLVMELDPAAGVELDLQAKVVRSDEDGLAGLRLERLGAADREQLVRWVTARQREALAELRDA